MTMHSSGDGREQQNKLKPRDATNKETGVSLQRMRMIYTYRRIV